MILLQSDSFFWDDSSLSYWVLVSFIIGLVVYRIFIHPQRNRKTSSEAEVDNSLYRNQKSPLESTLRDLIWGLDIHHINSDRFSSPLLAAIFTKIQLTLTIIALTFIVLFFANGGWQGGLIILGITAFFLGGYSSQYIRIWKKELGGKDILTGLYWYHKDHDKSLMHLKKASEVNDDPFMSYIIAHDLKLVESRKSEEEQDYSEVIGWFEQIVNNSNYDIKESLQGLISSLNRNHQYEEALSYLPKYEEEYGSELPWEYQIAYRGLAERYELQCNLERAIEYYEKALEIEGDKTQPFVYCVILSKLIFFYAMSEEFAQSKDNAKKLTHTYLLDEYQNRPSKFPETYNEFIEMVSLPFKMTNEMDGYVSMLFEGIETDGSGKTHKRVKLYLAKFLRVAGRAKKAEALDLDLLENHGENMPEERSGKDYRPSPLEMSIGQWNWDQVIAICDEKLLEENPQNKPYYYRTLLKALLYKGKLNESLLNLDSLLELKRSDSTIYMNEEDYRFFAKLYQAGCMKEKAIEIYQMWIAKEERSSYVDEDKIRRINKKIRQLT